MVTLALNLGLNLLLMRPLAHMGPPLATSLASSLNAGLLAWGLSRRGWFRPDAELGATVICVGLATALMAAVLLGLANLLPEALRTGHGVLAATGLAIEIGVGLVIYVAAAGATGVDDLRRVVARLRRRVAA